MDQNYNPMIPIILVAMLAHLALGFYEKWVKKTNSPNFFMPISYVALTLLVMIWLFDPMWHF